MATITTRDVLFATASQNGRNLANLCLSGHSSTSSVIAELRRMAGGALGLVRVTLRNATQGWSHVFTLYLRPESMQEGVQLSLF